MWRAVLLTLSVLAGASAQDLVVRTAQGFVRGSLMRTVENRQIFTFRGLRFAEPPVDELRFQPPRPVQPWEGIRNATSDGFACPQVDSFFGETSEDCLFLNVYTTQLPGIKGANSRPRPVMVFFHPGGFYSVTGNSIWAGPHYLLDEDIVLVTTNYRLGALGFLSTEDGVLPGNYGLKDQVQVLRWVKENIAVFGGDPSSVTISGYSAGSFSVFLHMLSPMSKGLFHRAIAMSCSPIKQPPSPSPPRVQAKRQAELLNCRSASSKEIRDCLSKKEANEIVATQTQFREFAYDPVLVFAPVVEPDKGDGAERFLTADAHELLAAGKFAKVPLMTGVTTLEFAWKALEVLTNSTWAQEMTDDFERIAPISFQYERGTERSRHISRELRKFYLKDKPVTNDTEIALAQLYADAIIIFGEDRAAKLVARKSDAPVYFYKFSYAGRYSYVYYPVGSNTPYGVAHHDDLIYLFYNSISFPLLTPSAPEYHTMKKMIKMWANFVKGGNPTPDTSPLLDNVKWEKFTTDNLKYLDIGSTLEMKRGLYQDRMAVWDKLFPIPGERKCHHRG